MSSNGLWTTMEVYHPHHPLHFAPPRDNTPQDEPIDFSQKSDSSDKEASPKASEDALQNGGHLAEILSRGGYTSLEQLYLVRNASDLHTKKEHTPDELSRNVNYSPHLQLKRPFDDRTPDSRTMNCSLYSRASPAMRVGGSPSPLAASYQHNRSAAVVSPSSSHTSDGKTSPLLSSPECKLPNFGAVFPGGKGQKRFLESEPSGEKLSEPQKVEHFSEQKSLSQSPVEPIENNYIPSSSKGQNRFLETETHNGYKHPSHQDCSNGHSRLANKHSLDTVAHASPPPAAAATQSAAATQQPALAQLLMSGNTSCPTAALVDTKPVDTKCTPHTLPRVTVPITSPMMVRKANASSPMQPLLLPGFSPPEDPARMPPSSLVPMPNPWEVYPTMYQQDDKKSRNVRPFKAFGNEILSSCKPEVLASMGGGRSAAFEKFIRFRSEYMDGRHETPADSTRALTSPESVQRSNHDSNDSEVGDSQQDQPIRAQRRSGTKFPDQHKDPAYWERRRKNNEAAKRSRDARRRKEDALAMTAKELLEDKMRMTMHLSFQMKEMRKLEEENRFLKEREIALQNCLFHLERRCRDCSNCSGALLGDAAEDRKQHCNTN